MSKEEEVEFDDVDGEHSGGGEGAVADGKASKGGRRGKGKNSDANEDILVRRGVINEGLIRGAVRKELLEHHDDSLVPSSADIDLENVNGIALSFANVFKIDNLSGFARITKLQLDNNIIEKIENLDHLVNLRWLDLSFNNITRIENLENLRQLEDLTLFNNNIEKIENLENLANLNVLSLGNNQIKDVEYIRELRQFKNLRLLNLKGNPVCDSDDYYNVVFAFLTTLKYLDYTLIEPQQFHVARDAKLDEIYALEEKEKGQAEREAEEAQKQEREGQLTQANIGGLSTLFEIMTQEDKEHVRVKLLPDFGHISTDFRKVFEDEVATFTEKFLAAHELKVAEHVTFSAALSKVNKASEKMQIKLIQMFESRKKKAFRKFEKIWEEDQDGSLELLEGLREEVFMVTHDLMSLEMQLVDKNNKIIQDFVEEYTTMSKANLNRINDFFTALNDAEENYALRTTKLAAAVLEKIQAGETITDDDEVDNFLKDREQVNQAVSQSHENHVTTISQKQDDLTETENSCTKSTSNGIMRYEYERNRNRVVEIEELTQYYVDQIDVRIETRKEEIEESRYVYE
jgi:hypothetical protein